VSTMTALAFGRRIFDERKRVLLPLVVVLVANILALALVIVPLKAAVALAESRAVEVMRELGEARRLERDVAQARTSTEQADKELTRFYAEVLPRDFPAAQKTLALWLTEAARDAGLEFHGSHLDWSEVKDSRLSRFFSQVTLEGRYPSIRRFLYSVETAKEFIVVEKVELAQTSDQPAADGLLEVALVVSTYFVTKPGP
jgi:Tfp pilus assembly protein PilO